MKEIFEDYLFSQGYFVADPIVGQDADQAEEHAGEALVALARYAKIRITAHPERANIGMLKIAERNLGKDIPEGFYRGFPQTVRWLSPDELAFDQLLHYFRTYGLGDFSEAGHSLFEEHYERAAFTENVEAKDFAIISTDEAEELLTRMARGYLASTRPLSASDYTLLEGFLETHPGFSIGRCASKDTAAWLIIDMRDPELARLIELPDVIYVVDTLIGASIFPSRGTSVYKMNLRNQDRKLITGILDRLFERGNVNTAACLEKKRAWNGLLHHIHYQPKCAEAEAFCQAIRGKEQRSPYSAMEERLAAGDVRGATDVLRESKGPGAMLRHLDYLLSRIDMSDLMKLQSASAPREETRPVAERLARDIAYVLDACETNNKILLIQQLIRYNSSKYLADRNAPRVFTFVNRRMVRVHRETVAECGSRRSVLPTKLVEFLCKWSHDQLARACRGTLGKVYVDEKMRNVALPLQEGASMGGFGTLARGTRIPLPQDKKVRAFTYWEKVNDIDLSCFALQDDGWTEEFSWRTMAWSQEDCLVFSGDETSGFHGGSEFFDVDLELFAEMAGPKYHYLVFCNNVFSGGLFSECTCRAGYMLRDKMDSGEVFEPATVETSFTINCPSRAAFLFALDLRDPALIWLNMGENSMQNIAGEGDVSFLMKYLHTVDAMNVHEFARLLATEVVDSPADADVVFSDEPPEALGLREDQELIRSRDTARFLQLLN